MMFIIFIYSLLPCCFTHKSSVYIVCAGNCVSHSTSEFLISLYGAPLAQRASYLALHSSLFGPDGTVNYDYIVTNSINSVNWLKMYSQGCGNIEPTTGHFGLFSLLLSWSPYPLYTVQFHFSGHSLDLLDNVLHDWLFPHHCVLPMAHTLTIVEPIWPMLQNVSKTLVYMYDFHTRFLLLLVIVPVPVIELLLGLAEGVVDDG